MALEETLQGCLEDLYVKISFDQDRALNAIG